MSADGETAMVRTGRGRKTYRSSCAKPWVNPNWKYVQDEEILKINNTVKEERSKEGSIGEEESQVIVISDDEQPPIAVNVSKKEKEDRKLVGGAEHYLTSRST